MTRSLPQEQRSSGWKGDDARRGITTVRCRFLDSCRSCGWKGDNARRGITTQQLEKSSTPMLPCWKGDDARRGITTYSPQLYFQLIHRVGKEMMPEGVLRHTGAGYFDMNVGLCVGKEMMPGGVLRRGWRTRRNAAGRRVGKEMMPEGVLRHPPCSVTHPTILSFA